MNISGVIRGYMSKNMGVEEFIVHVATLMEKQLKEWDENYEVYVMKLTDYEFIVKNNDTYYGVDISADEIAELQNKNPFALDKKLWIELEHQGLNILRGYGDYLDKVF
ncbi:hypothetical protein [Bacillus benzoevorans]|uniref:Uncharacterized protein n=1 Tax=Bacillus benzoevorans TaxID=1456 RepID=A0A7X0HNF2_9BACI|nr:hypothetical protein [Bacillus benzoevorans]MBB6444022.1 hypothetical protein [Bacillus benzoevorans]